MKNLTCVVVNDETYFIKDGVVHSVSVKCDTEEKRKERLKRIGK